MHLEVLGDKAKEIFKKLKHFPNFYLVGGTALALQIGHRISVDFDLFNSENIPRSLYLKVEKIFKENKIDIIVNNAENLTILVDGVQLTFFNYPFEVISPFIIFQDVKILPVVELGALKVYALGRRATFKDYVDLYYILNKKLVSLVEITDLAERKYKDKFDKRLFLEQLIYLEDIKDTEIKFLGSTITKKEMIEFFTGLVKEVKLY
ncbi:MAG: hypothetical protein US31_C0001G0003 [Berkelbacteria bacterium GW2011_GWA1_36_9]|uniref:Nucleotidyl transferase AbiEii/AbiGii toxin family protein n=1 Tax=Berkelbacteria bacterium GW2011_GWA1_36_9 TaxID=1618331 RepID=A0A0G0IS29_9BACT|nr:MAG: hypothetical protein US31_C0001G0003 [Berkelbacteria bacterium GW2011_GWA1_36_9]